MFFKRKAKCSSNAGLAIMSNGLYYLELDTGDLSNLKLLKYEFVGYSNRAVEQSTFVDMRPIKDALEDLVSRIGTFPCSVNVGIPSREVMIKNVDFPKMEMSMVREALHWEFDKYFPYPVLDALYDVVPVDLPARETDDENMHLLVASIQRNKIESFLEYFKEAGISINSIEPNGVPAFRSTIRGIAPENSGYIVLLPFATELQLMVGYRESGLFYRVVPLRMDGNIISVEDIANRAIVEIQATLNYIRSLFRGFTVESIILGGDLSVREGLVNKISTSLEFKVISTNPWTNWNISGAPEEAGDSESVVGLAVRDLE